MTLQEAKQHLARKLNIDYSDIANNDLFSDTDLGVYIQLGAIKAWDYKSWPFKQKSKQVTTISTAYYDHPSDLVNNSIFLLKVGGKEYKKILYQDYLKYLEDDPSGEYRYWSEWETFIFINQNAYTVGDTLILFGQKLAPVLSSSGDLLPFSPISDNSEYSGNEAIVQLGYAEALDSEKLKNPEQAGVERKKAYQTLDLLWKPFADEKALMQSSGRPMFDVPDFFSGRANANNSQYTGNFNYLN